jgi:hypothetical protein
MRNAANLLCFLAAGTLVSAENNSRWADVPASRDTPRINMLSTPYAPTEKDVCLVESASPPNPMTLEPVPVLSVGLDDFVEPPSRAKDIDVDVPSGTLWPDATGRIVAVLPQTGGSLANNKIRNPWLVRIHPKPRASENVFQCGGLIIGGEGGPVAFLNGRTVKRGDSIGKFRVMGVRAEGVILELAGFHFMVPVRRRTSVSIVEG